MSKLKLTPWLPFSERPIRPGVYNVSCRNTDQTGLWYARFDGYVWSYWERASQSAESHRLTIKKAGKNPGIFRKLNGNGTWRGLASKDGK